MSFLDKAKQAFGTAKDKAGELASEHSDKIDSAIDKGGSFIDQKTHGKYADKVAKAGSTAKGAAEKLAAQHEPGTAGTTGATPDPQAPGTGTPPAADTTAAPGAGGQAGAHPTESTDPIPQPDPIDPPEPLRPEERGDGPA